MLVIISDLHLGDGTTADSIPPSAFELFAKRLRQDAHFAAMNYRKDEPFGTYKPFEQLDVILLGDILDPLHSTGWLYPLQDTDSNSAYQDEGGKKKFTFITNPGEADYIRPWSWTDSIDPVSRQKFAKKLREVTLAILEHNQPGLKVFRDLAAGTRIEFDGEDGLGGRSDSAPKIPLKVKFYYMVGNHDWYYHLPGEEFNEIRKIIIENMGLQNQPGCPFPYDLGDDIPEKIKSKEGTWRTDIQEGNDDAIKIRRLLEEYRVFARHGDYYDSFNFDKEKGRNYATLGDVFTMEVCNRFPPHLEKAAIDAQSRKLIPPHELNKYDGNVEYLVTGGNTAYVREMRQITNIRPALATPLLITGQLKRLSQDIILRRSKQFENLDDKVKEEEINKILRDFEHAASKEIRSKAKELEYVMKEVWDQLVDEFLELDFVRAKDKWGLDIVDKLQFVVKISKTISSRQLDDLVYMFQNQKAAGHDRSFAKFALEEPAFLQSDINRRARFFVYGHTHHHEVIPMDYDAIYGNKYMYFNSGTWHTYFDLTRKDPKEKKFIPYKTLTYITFYKKEEHGDQDFETWSGAYA